MASASLLKMKREQYQKQINDLLQAVETVAEAYENLKEKYAKLEGELAMRKRGQ